MEQCLTTNLNKNLFFQRRDYVEDIFGSVAGSKNWEKRLEPTWVCTGFLEKNREINGLDPVQLAPP